MSVRLISCDSEVEKGSHTFTQVHYKEHRLSAEVAYFDTMHVQLSFRSPQLLHQCLRRALDFTSQRSEFEPQTSQPLPEEEAVCMRYDGSQYISERWKFAGCKIQEDVESILGRVDQHLDDIDGFYIHP